MDVRPGRKRRQPQFEIMHSQCLHTSRATRWYFHLRSANGEISLQSELYPTKNHARRAIVRLIKVIAAEPPIVVVE
jgi:uncharacterized protein YegP (UPF0339 family)